jgi:hypothetical protein
MKNEKWEAKTAGEDSFESFEWFELFESGKTRRKSEVVAARRLPKQVLRKASGWQVAGGAHHIEA